MFIKTLRIKEIIKFIICICFAFLLITMPQLSLSGVAEGLALCSRAIVPSIFPFMVLSKYIIYSGYALKLSKIIGEPCHKLPGFPGEAAAALVLGIAGGYPIGAASICDMVKSGQLSKNSGELMLPYCNNASPLFVIGTVGSVFLNNKSAGVVIYIIHILSSLICAFVYRKSFAPHFKPQTGTAAPPCRTPFITAVSDAAYGTVNICAYILFFSVVNKAVAIVPFKSDLTQSILYGFFEISNGAQSIACLSLNPVFKYALICAILSFSGLCVYLQVSASVKDASLSLKPYLKGKLLCSVLSFILAYAVFGMIGICFI